MCKMFSSDAPAEISHAPEDAKEIAKKLIASGVCNIECVANASINSSGAHPPPPQATAGYLLALSVPGVGHSQFYRSLGAGH